MSDYIIAQLCNIERDGMPRGMRMGLGGRMAGPMMDPRSRFFMILASDQRLKILDFLKQGEKSTAQLIEAVGLDASVVSRHMMMLRNMGVVVARKEGVALYFRIADERIFQIIEIATKIIQDWFKMNRDFFEF